MSEVRPVTTCCQSRLGVVQGLFVASASGQPMESRRSVRALAGTGILGDRYAEGLGHWSDPRWPDQELSLVEDELADELALTADQLRRNIVTRGVALGELIRRDFRIGTAWLRGMRTCDPCRYLETLTRPGIYEELDGRGGLRAAILRSGWIRVGDRFEVHSELCTAHPQQTADQNEP